jgi:hypothetical protein
MRTLALLLAVAPAAVAQQTLATVGPDAATLRSGPGDKMPDTGVLPAGTTVIVHHEYGDWVAIQPPRGALAWVLAPLVDGVSPARPWPQNGVVSTLDGHSVKLAAGRTGYGLPLLTQRTSVPDGTVLTVVGPKVKAEDGAAWYPVVPPEDDFRYLPRASVQAATGRRAGGYVVRSPNLPGDDRPTAVPASVGRAADPPASGLWAEAERAERAGEYARAESLYLRLAGEANRAGDLDTPPRCYARVHALREKQRGSRTAAPAEDWAGPGSLRASGLNYTGRQTYALVGARGEVKCYVLAGPGLELESRVGERVELFGRTTYPGDLRGTPLLTATRVRATSDERRATRQD